MKINNIAMLSILISILSCMNQDKSIITIKEKPNHDSINLKELIIDNEIETDINPWGIDRIVGKMIVFQNGDSMKTTLNDLEYLGQFNYNDTTTYYLLAGLDCDGCDAEISMYIHSPNSGDLIVENGENRYNLAGKTYDYLDESLVYESRVFFGEIFSDTVGVLWMQKILQDDNTFKESSYLFHILDSTIWRGTLEYEYTIIEKRIELQIRKGLCKELEGKEYSTSP